MKGIMVMKASEKPLSFLKEAIVYRVPFFQRPYVWKETNWDGIWEELSAERGDCFLGSIILKKDDIPILDENDGSVICNNTKTIIDGQQRLTTLSILLRAFMDYYAQQKDVDEEYLKYFSDLIFYTSKKHLKSGIKISERSTIEHSRLNNEVYRKIIEGKVNWQDYIGKDPKQIAELPELMQCYLFFADRIAETGEDEHVRICDKLTLDENNILVVIDLEQNENEQIIFDTINSTGVKLTASDIIKNAIFHSVRKGTTSIEKLYAETWQKCFEEDDDLVDKWLEVKGIGQNQRSNIDLFFYSFAILEGFFKIPGDKMSDLAQIYKTHLSQLNAKQTEMFLRKICDYADTYKEYFIDKASQNTYTFDKDDERLLHILKTVKITAFDPFILYVLKNYDEMEQNSFFRKVECYVVRHYVIGNSSRLGSFMQDAVAMINGDFDFEDKLNEDIISDARFEQALKSINNIKAKLLLFWVELYRQMKYKEYDLHYTPLSYSFELEHIMPQKWNEHWKLSDLPVLDENGEVLPEDLAEQERKQAIYEIGNMTLLTSKMNKTLQNYSFYDKVNGAVIDKKERPGMKQYASLSISKEVIQLEPPVWNEEQIHKRTARLTKEIEQIWTYKYN